MKCDNVMITLGGVAKIMDFGLAKLHDRAQLTHDGTTLGTLAYMSPEQVRSEPVDARTDIWALGVILYEMLTGVVPFRADQPHAVIYKILQDEPIPPRTLRADTPEALELLILLALDKDKDRRPAAVAELIPSLQAVLAGSHTTSVAAPVSTTADKATAAEPRSHRLPGVGSSLRSEPRCSLPLLSGLTWWTLQKRNAEASASCPMLALSLACR